MPSWGAGRRLWAVLCTGVLLLGAPACGGDDEDASVSSSSSSARSSSSSTSSSSSSTSTTKQPTTPEEEVEAAYLRSWDVYAKAVRDLDPSGLEEAFAMDALELLRAEVERLKNDGTPAEIDVEHDFEIESANATTALVFDTYISNSVLLDPETGERTERGPPDTVRKAYQLERAGGIWKVVFIRSLE